VISLYQGVTAGGLRRNFAYGGHGDFVLNADFGKLGLQEGLFLKLRAEDRIGMTINRNTGSLLPAAVIGDLPALQTRDLALTNVVSLQTAIFGREGGSKSGVSIVVAECISSITGAPP